VIAVCGGDMAAAPAWLKVVFAHEPPNLLVVDDHAPVAQLGANAPPPIVLEFFANRGDGLDDRSVVVCRNGPFVICGARNPHQPAFCDAEAWGPTMTDVLPLLGRGGLF